MIDPVVVILLLVTFAAGLVAGGQIARKRILKRSFAQRLALPEPVVEFSSWEQLQSYGDKLRKEGRYDEAVQLHQALLAKDDWQAFYQAIQFELAEDFYFSGLYDRAERIYHLTLESSDYHRQSLLRLASIAARLRDWQRLSELLAGEKSLTGELAKLYVHSQCEIALRHREHGLHELADSMIKRLQQSFPSHPRVQTMGVQPSASGKVMDQQPLMKLLDQGPTVARFQQVIVNAHSNQLALSQLYQQLVKAGWLERRYQCGYCGYSASEHYWQCPQCEHWETIKDHS